VGLPPLLRGELRRGQRRIRGRSAGDREGPVSKRAPGLARQAGRDSQRAASGRLVRQGRPRPPTCHATPSSCPRKICITMSARSPRTASSDPTRGT
jgi:hypothetical protein